MDKKYTAKVTIKSRYPELMMFGSFTATLNWVEDDAHGGPTNESVLDNLKRDYKDTDFEPILVGDLKEISNG